MSAMLAVHPATPDRAIDELDKVYSRLMLGDRAVDRKQASTSTTKASVSTVTRQLKRRNARLLAKQAVIKGRIDEIKQMR